MKVNALPARSSGRLQVKSEEELRQFFEPFGVDIVPERSDRDAVRIVTAGRGI